jgi:hypothetical protein
MLLSASDFAFDQTSTQPEDSVSGGLVRDGAPPWQEINTQLRSWDTQADNPITRKDS